MPSARSETARLKPLTYEEGISVGATRIDKAALKFLPDNVAEVPGIDSKVLADDAVHGNFQEINHDYGTNTSDKSYYLFPIPSLTINDDLPAKHFDGTSFKTPAKTIIAWFDKEIEQIVQLGEKKIEILHEEHTKEMIRWMVLSGGFGQNQYVRDELKEYLRSIPTSKDGAVDETEMMDIQEINHPYLGLSNFCEFSPLVVGDKQSRITISCQYQYAAIRGEQSSSESSVVGIIAMAVAAWESYHQLSSVFGLFRKGNKSNFLRSRTNFSLAKVICLLTGVRQRCHGFIPEAPGPLVMRTTNLLIGDGESGPQAGPASMGREDDDDDDCVGFHKFSRLNQSSGVVEKGAQLQARINICNLHKHSRCATIPKYGPPKRDPVAAAMSRPIRQSLDASTLNTWRDVISRTCREGADPYSAKAKEWQGSSWQSAVVGLG